MRTSAPCAARGRGRPGASIRTASPGDLEPVLRLLVEVGSPIEGVDAHFGSFLVAEGDDGSIEGVVGLELHAGAALLRSLAVRPDARGLGRGRALTDRAVGLARASGVPQVHLLTTTAADWFERLGFREVAREHAPPALHASPQFSGACPASATLMVGPAGVASIAAAAGDGSRPRA